MSRPFRYDQTITDYGQAAARMEPLPSTVVRTRYWDRTLSAEQLAARRKRQREWAAAKRRTDSEWVARRNAAQRRYRAKAPTLKDENPNDPRNPAEHGTVQRYRRHKCRCPRCTMAQRDAMRIYRTGDPGPEENLR